MLIMFTIISNKRQICNVQIIVHVILILIIKELLMIYKKNKEIIVNMSGQIIKITWLKL